jgi:NTE family protein
MPSNESKTALILSGGGARGAYQVGVLKAIAHLQPNGSHNPFDIICGTSAGAINACVLACESDHYGHAITRLEHLWSNIDSRKIHKVGFLPLLKSTLRIFGSFFREGKIAGKPKGLLDNTPLRHLLESQVDFSKLPERLAQGDLTALSITALAYNSGKNVSFYQGAETVDTWRRNQRVGLRTVLNHDHLMASSALPAIFPAVNIQGEYFGDGAIRQSTPLSAALHLGADRLFVIGVSHNAQELPEPSQTDTSPPSFAQIAGHLLNSSFIDAMDVDLEMLERFNLISAYLTTEQQNTVRVRPVEVLTITPSIRFDDIAANHIGDLPRSMRTFFKTIGATRAGGGASMASYLLFESAFCRELMAAGYADTMAREGEIMTFLNAAPQTRQTAPRAAPLPNTQLES